MMRQPHSAQLARAAVTILVLISQCAVVQGWFAGARAKHASLQSMAHCQELFAAYADTPGATPDVAEQRSIVTGKSSWSATDGFRDTSFISFADEAYAAMRDDESRTPQFAAAIQARLEEAPANTLVVLDIGTGPHAVLALLAARSGARKVYAIEASHQAACRARATVESAGFQGVVEVIEGFSTSVELPEKVDLVVSEIVGSIASEEGVYASIKDAHERFVKSPLDPASWIPCQIETWGVPCSYALQYALGGEHYDWGCIREPLRLNCRDGLVLPLHDTAQLVESIDFTDPNLPSADASPRPVESVFVVEEERLRHNERRYFDMLCTEGVEPQAARLHAGRAARGLSGLAMWCRLTLRQGRPRGKVAVHEAAAGDVEEIVVETRGAGAGGASGEPGDSCWQTVLPLLDGRPVTVTAGSVIRTRATVELPGGVDDPLQYSVDVHVLSPEAQAIDG